MERRNGAWVMTAGVVCFPTRWRPSEKIGRTMAAIHEPVPRYDDIATAVDRFFDRLHRAAWRGGRIGRWSATQHCSLRPTIAKPLERFDPDRDLLLQVEQQTCGALNTLRMRSCSPSAFISGRSVIARRDRSGAGDGTASVARRRRRLQEPRPLASRVGRPSRWGGEAVDRPASRTLLTAHERTSRPRRCGVQAATGEEFVLPADTPPAAASASPDGGAPRQVFPPVLRRSVPVGRPTWR